jgi:hypothetical protein
LPARNSTVTVWANNTYDIPGAVTRNHVLQHSEILANPVIVPGTLTANPTQVTLGGSTTLTLTTNHEVNHVWAVVNGIQHSATRTNPNAAATSARTWSLTISPTVSGTVTVHANATNTPTGAVTQNIWIEALPTRVQINHAHAAWHPTGATSANATEVQIQVHTNMYATNVSLTVGGSIFPMEFDQTTVAGNTRIWTLRVHRGSLFTSTSPITVTANDTGNPWGTWHNVTGVIPGVGSSFIPGSQQGQGNNQGSILNFSFNPTIVHPNQLWPVTGTFTTGNDVTAIRVRDVNWNTVGPASVTAFTLDASGNRVWTVGSMFPVVPAGATSVSLTIQAQRDSTVWGTLGTVQIPVQ